MNRANPSSRRHPFQGIKQQRLRQILKQAREKRVLVLGDLMLDEFVWGTVGRISPEAPVPVVEVSGESFCPGGAANVARNLREFTDHVAVAGMLGRDRCGNELLRLLATQQIDTEDCAVSREFATIVKTRIIARHQQVVRVDREKIAPPTKREISSVVEAVKKKMPQTDAILFEDYGKGFLAEELVTEVISAAHADGKIVAVDPNPRHDIAWRGVSVMKPNRNEAFHAAGVLDDASDRSLEEVGRRLLEKWETELLLITLGDEGMMLFQRDQEPHRVPTRARQVFDVSGAGDTAIALFTLALTGGATPLEATEIANHASAVVVGKLGTATVTRNELVESFANA